MDEIGRFEACYAKYGAMLFRLALSQLGTKEAAEDVVQEVFLKRMSRRDFRDIEHEKRWLIRVTVNECHSLWRKEGRRREVSLSGCLPAAEISQEERLQTEAMLASMEPETRLIFHLYYYEGYNLSEISEMLGWSLSKVKMRLKRGRDRLRMSWEES